MKGQAINRAIGIAQRIRIDESLREIEASEGGLLSKNVSINGRRTSVRLEIEMWDAVTKIAKIEGISRTDLLGAIWEFKPTKSSFTSAIRTFLLNYFMVEASLNPREKYFHDKTEE